MITKLYLWREEQPVPPAADSLSERLAQDSNLPSVEPISFSNIESSFSGKFPGIAILDRHLKYQTADTSFKVSFYFDNLDQVKCVLVTSETSVLDNPEFLESMTAVAQNLGCTRMESVTE